MKRLNKPQRHLRYKKVLLRVGLYRQSLGREEGEVFTRNEENRVHLLLKIPFSSSYPTAKDNSVLSDNLITGGRKKRRRKMAKVVGSEAILRWVVKIVIPLKSTKMDGILPALLQRYVRILGSKNIS